MLEFLEKTAKDAGVILLTYLNHLKPEDISPKGAAIRDMQTKADVESEQHIVRAISERFPNHSIYAEESSLVVKDEKHWWIIDPLDGTVNFTRRFPFFSVSIAYYFDGKPVAGVVFAPKLDEMFLAQKNQGAFCNGRKCTVSQTTSMSGSILASGFSYFRNELKNNNFETFTKVGLSARGVRRAGSAAIDLAYVADGRFDGFWEYYLSPWDVGAGILLVEEAGGKVTDYQGSHDYKDFIFGKNIAASNGHIHDEIIDFMGAPDEDFPQKMPVPQIFLK
ncbi:MAG: inositol monophosphatase [Planctomycetes bacterium]|nr:inositol monophosphatase [Planctomycetota bacterium]